MEWHGMVCNEFYASAGSLSNGPSVDENTLFDIGSISKRFTGVLLTDSFLTGKADLQDSRGKHLPDGILKKNSPLHQITLAQLSTHTSGLPVGPSNLFSSGGTRNVSSAHDSRVMLLEYVSEMKPKELGK